jgi:hypothetical protein
MMRREEEESLRQENILPCWVEPAAVDRMLAAVVAAAAAGASRTWPWGSQRAESTAAAAWVQPANKATEEFAAEACRESAVRKGTQLDTAVAAERVVGPGVGRQAERRQPPEDRTAVAVACAAELHRVRQGRIAAAAEASAGAACRGLGNKPVLAAVAAVVVAAADAAAADDVCLVAWPLWPPVLQAPRLVCLVGPG